MPITKNGLVRMKVIDECLRSRTRKYWSKQELMDTMLRMKDIQVSGRTLECDLSMMRYCTQLAYHAPIAYSKLENGYYYTDPTYSIEKLPLSASDITALEIAAATLRQYRDVDAMHSYAAALDKVIRLVSNIRRDKVGDTEKIIDFEKAPYSKGLAYFDLLVEAIQNRCVLLLSYQKFNDSLPKQRTISPYLLKEYRNRWYLLAIQHDVSKLKIFGLDRIIDLEELESQVYKAPVDFNIETFFRHTIGISLQSGVIEDVILSFTPHDGHYVKTQHLHSTQEVLLDNTREFRIKMQVVVNYELISTILSFGHGVEVLHPVSLREKIRETSKTMSSQYESGGSELLPTV